MSLSSPNPTQETPESNPNSSSLQTQSNSSRGKSDPAWGHCRFSDETTAKKHLNFMFCSKIFKGGGINRIKQYLAGIKGDTESCKKVPTDVGFQLHDNVVNFNQRKRKAQEEVRESTHNSQDQEHEVHHNNEERYHYDTNEMEKHKIAISGVLDVIERYAHNDRALEEKLNEEVTIFRNVEGDFGRRLAVNSRNTKMPEDEPPTLTVDEIEARNRELPECSIEENHPYIDYEGDSMGHERTDQCHHSNFVTYARGKGS
ncbi:putative Zinc finger, BED-type [Senna tora]|uniref:Putative Zinc finger, BED-type n=1 Tax=Senna tora TaxID=362788 RepID=A0A834SC52_9FABA|nr:putative Zinc finger, BED-type [Senna tora]